MNRIMPSVVPTRRPLVARFTTQAAKQSPVLTQVDTTLPIAERPTTMGYLAVKDLTPRPSYGPERHPTYPIVLMRNVNTGLETPYMIFGYTGKNADASQDIMKNGLTRRVFATNHYEHAYQYAENGKVFTLGITLDAFTKIANGYQKSLHTAEELLSSPQRCQEIQQPNFPRGNTVGFEDDDRSEDFREYQSMYCPLRHLITVSSTILDVKDPKSGIGNSLDLAIFTALDKAGQYNRDHSLLAKILPSAWMEKLERRPNLEGLFPDKRG